MVFEVKDLGIAMDSTCLDAGQPRAEHPDANILHGLCQDVGLDPRDSISRDYFDAIPELEMSVVPAEAGYMRFKRKPTNAIVPVTMPHASLSGPPAASALEDGDVNAQLLQQNAQILANMKAQQIQVENLISEVNVLRAQPDARSVVLSYRGLFQVLM
eukprot:SAG11_NODE_2372_length_3446_cov_9.306543_1_plen_158_part_00